MQQELSLPALLSVSVLYCKRGERYCLGGTGQINQLQAEFTDASKTMYDGTEVSGSEVLNVIRKFSDETMGILVQTNKNKTYYNYNFDVDKGSWEKR